MSSENYRVIAGSIRRMILVILVLAMISTAAELLLLDHDEGILQLVPLFLIAAGVLVLSWHAASGTLLSLRVFRIVMGAFIAAGALGVVLHYRGSVEFQKEVDPSIHGVSLFMKVMKSKAPPALAPALMAQLGLLGLVYTYGRHAEEGREINEN